MTSEDVSDMVEKSVAFRYKMGVGSNPYLLMTCPGKYYLIPNLCFLICKNKDDEINFRENLEKTLTRKMIEVDDKVLGR